MLNIKEIYDNNKSFREYCNKAIERGEAPSLEALLTHKMIHHVAQYYMEREGYDNKIH